MSDRVHSLFVGRVVSALLLLPLLLPILLGGLMGCDAASDGDAGGKGKRASKPLTVRTIIAREEQVERVVEITGTLAGAEQVTVSAESEGRVEKVVADLGDQVVAGGTLIQLAREVPRLQALQAEADYQTALARIGVDDAGLESATPASVATVRRAAADREDAARSLARVRDLFAKKVAAQSDLDAAVTRDAIADAALAAARDEAAAAIATAFSRRATLALARKRLSDTTIKSPVAGVVANRQVSLGALVTMGQPVATVVIDQTLKLRGDVPERYSDVVKAGLALDLQVAATQATAKARVSRVGPLIDSASRTFPIEAIIDNADGQLKPGAFARASVVVGTDEAVIAVPEVAVSNVAGVAKVFVVDEHDAHRAADRRVQVLRKRGSDALVTGDLRAGERVIVTAIARLFPGAPIDVDDTAPVDTGSVDTAAGGNATPAAEKSPSVKKTPAEARP